MRRHRGVSNAIPDIEEDFAIRRAAPEFAARKRGRPSSLPVATLAFANEELPAGRNSLWIAGEWVLLFLGPVRLGEERNAQSGQNDGESGGLQPHFFSS
jgi:hypothetical protein